MQQQLVALSPVGDYSGVMIVRDQKMKSIVADLRRQVTAAQQEFDMAVTFHETWKPAAYDKDLHERMGRCYAANTFFVVRSALRREMLLALMRLWDKDSRTIRMKESIADILRKPPVINALAADRAKRIGMADAEDEMRKDLSQKACKAVALVDKYSKNGTHYAVLENLHGLRHKRLAHRQIEAIPVATADSTDVEIEAFYQDNSELIHLLLGLVKGVAYDPKEAAEVYRCYAAFFWAGVRGERTEGHPNYPAPPRVTPTT